MSHFIYPPTDGLHCIIRASTEVFVVNIDRFSWFVSELIIVCITSCGKFFGLQTSLPLIFVESLRLSLPSANNVNNVSKLNCLLPTRAHNYCILHMLNVCGMQCTSYYIGYLHYNIKAGCRDGRSKGFYTFQLKVYSCAQPATPPPLNNISP